MASATGAAFATPPGSPRTQRARCAATSPAPPSSNASTTASSSSFLSSPARVDVMEWVSASPEQHPRFRIPVSVLLNPAKSDVYPPIMVSHTLESSSSTAAPDASIAALVPTQTPPQPKRRGRKPILPKMNNSERGKYYRSKRKRYGDALADSVAQLRDDVVRLRALQDICSDLRLGMRMSLPGSLAQIVREYFAQFRYGVQLPPAQRNMMLPDVQVSTMRQDLFMRATMAPDVSFGEYSGIETVMDQWARYSQYHALLEFELLSIDISGLESAPILSTTGRLRTRYSRKTIENVFPHVVGNEALTQRLIGQEIVYPCRNQFYFRDDGRIERYDVEADFVAALVSALGNSQDAALLLGQALIQKQHMMGVIDGNDVDDDSGGNGAEPRRSSRSPQLEVEYLLDGDDDDGSSSTMMVL